MRHEHNRCKLLTMIRYCSFLLCMWVSRLYGLSHSCLCGTSRDPPAHKDRTDFGQRHWTGGDPPDLRARRRLNGRAQCVHHQHLESCGTNRDRARSFDAHLCGGASACPKNPTVPTAGSGLRFILQRQTRGPRYLHIGTGEVWLPNGKVVPPAPRASISKVIYSIRELAWLPVRTEEYRSDGELAGVTETVFLKVGEPDEIASDYRRIANFVDFARVTKEARGAALSEAEIQLQTRKWSNVVAEARAQGDNRFQ